MPVPSWDGTKWVDAHYDGGRWVDASGNPITPTDQITPADRGFTGWNFDALIPGTATALTNGTIHGMRVKHRGGRVTNLHVGTSNALISGVAGQNFMGLFDVAGNRVAQSADLTALMGAAGAGMFTGPLSAPIDLPPGSYDLCILQNQSAGVNFQCWRLTTATGQASAGAPGFTAPRSFTAGAGQTALPASLGAKAEFGIVYWAALS